MKTKKIAKPKVLLPLMDKVSEALNGTDFMVKSIGIAPTKICTIGRLSKGNVECLNFDGFGVRYEGGAKSILEAIGDIEKGVILPKGSFVKAHKEVVEVVGKYFKQGRN